MHVASHVCAYTVEEKIPRYKDTKILRQKDTNKYGAILFIMLVAIIGLVLKIAHGCYLTYPTVTEAVFRTETCVYYI